MLKQYIQTALEKAKYEIIEDEENHIMEKFPNLKECGLQAKYLKNAVEIWKKSLTNGLLSG